MQHEYWMRDTTGTRFKKPLVARLLSSNDRVHQEQGLVSQRIRLHQSVTRLLHCEFRYETHCDKCNFFHNPNGKLDIAVAQTGQAPRWNSGSLPYTWPCLSPLLDRSVSAAIPRIDDLYSHCSLMT